MLPIRCWSERITSDLVKPAISRVSSIVPAMKGILFWACDNYRVIHRHDHGTRIDPHLSSCGLKAKLVLNRGVARCTIRVWSGLTPLTPLFSRVSFASRGVWFVADLRVRTLVHMLGFTPTFHFAAWLLKTSFVLGPAKGPPALGSVGPVKLTALSSDCSSCFASCFATICSWLPRALWLRVKWNPPLFTY